MGLGGQWKTSQYTPLLRLSFCRSLNNQSPLVSIDITLGILLKPWLSRPERGREQYFYSLNSVLHRTEYLHLDEFILINFSLSLIMLSVYPSKPKWVSPFSPLLYSSFIVLHFTFRPIVHFELIFMKRVRSVSRFTFCAGECPVVSIPFAEKTILSPVNCLCFFFPVKDQSIIFVWVYSWTLHSVPLIYLSFSNTTLS